MQALALISFYAPVVTIIAAIVAVLFSFFWIFLPLPASLSNAMGRLQFLASDMRQLSRILLR